MSAPRILCTQPLDAAAMADLRALGRVTVASRGRPPAPARLRALARESDAVVGLLCDRFDAKFFASAPTLKVLALDSAGFNHVDLTAARARGVTVTYCPGVLTEATADLTWALILACARRLPEGLELMRAGKFRGWDHNLLRGMELRGRTLGIIGMGRIGRAVAGRAAGFGMQVAYHSRTPLPNAVARRLKASRLPLRGLLAAADILSLHCPLTPETAGLIDRAALARMQPGAILINTARGPVVDERAVAAALRAGRLAAAGFDVFAGEPALSAALRRAPRCVVLPHLGSATDETRAAMGARVVANLRAALAGRRPPNAVPA